MGVIGLQTFLKNNKDKLANKVDISNTYLVIDASSLLCQLYIEPDQELVGPDLSDRIYGGDLVKFGQNVREFFVNLNKCKITAVLVFDGAVFGNYEIRDFVGSQASDSKRRGFERFKWPDERPKESPYDQDVLLPQNISYIFRSIVSELGVRRIQAPYEADTHIVRVANRLHCPVLTNDSDFLIYPLEKGFILLDHFHFKQPQAESNKWSIEATIFSQEKFVQSLGDFEIEVMPMLSIILGNDYVDAPEMDQIYNIFNGPYDGPFTASSIETHRRIGNLLNWLRGKSLEESIEYILELVSPEYREHMDDVISLLLRNYCLENEHDLVNELAAIYKPKRVASREHKTPVQFLRDYLERKDLVSSVLDIVFQNIHYNYSVLDSFSSASLNRISYRPIQLTLALLRAESYENLTESEKQEKAICDEFPIFRVDMEHIMIMLDPLETLRGFGTLDDLDCYSMIALRENTKQRILMACFRFTTEEQVSITKNVSRILAGPFVEQASLCILLVRYIAKQTECVPDSDFVNALMITLVYYAAQNDQHNEKYISTSEPLDQLVNRLQVDQKQPNSRRLIRLIRELQLAYKVYCLVNSLLDHPHLRPKQELFFNSVLIYNITRALQLGEETMESICGELPMIFLVCSCLQA